MLERIKNFFKNKSLGYYILCGIALYSIIFAIIFFATFANPALDPKGVNPMGNKADGMSPETIGIFLIGGFVVELVLILLPQYRFVHVAALVLYGLALYKEVLIIPDFIAGKANNVEYNGGSFELNMFYLISLILIVIAAVVVSFMGFYKDEEEAKREMGIKKNSLANIAKVGVGAVIVVAAVLASSLAANSVTKSGAAGKKQETSSSSAPIVEPTEKFNPITPDVEQICEAYDYSFVPEEIIIKEQDTWNWSDSRLSELSLGMTRTGDHHMYVCFEGTYTEGWQGDYSPTYGYMYLWDDGVFIGQTGKDTFKGFWYNSSIVNGTDPETNEDVKDCLVMVSNTSHFESIVTEPSDGFYSYKVQAFLNMGKVWNQGDNNGGSFRSIIMNGYYYYPEVAIAIDPSKTGLDFKVGDTFNRNGWVANRILKNKSFASIFKASEVSWTDQAGMVDSEGKFAAAGQYSVKAKWNNLEAEVTVNVTE